MPTFKARAIILRSHKLGEADKIIRMYSKQGRIISAVAKGSRKTKSRFRGRLELFNMADMELTRGRNLDVINQAEIIHCFTNISRDFYKFAFAEIISNIILKTQSSGNENPALFKLLYLSLYEIDSTAQEDELTLKKILCIFEAKFLHITGFTPMLDTCSSCNKDPGELYVMGKKDIFFSVANGGILCSQCSRETGAKKRLGTSTFRLLSDLFRLKMEDLREVELDPTNLKKVYSLLEDYLVYHTDCTLDSFRYLRKIGI
jgi:DNA repair protein RecO (recombination protein O)